MLECLKDPTLQSGSWNLWTTGKRKVLFACPKCSHVALLNQKIADDGRVIQKVKCAKQGCKFHDHLRLLGWIAQKEETGA